MPNSFTPQQIEDFLQDFFDVVGARQYIGARYVPIFGRAGEDTVEWDDGAPYEPLTVVMHQGVSYVSRRYVPTGIQVTDTDYWVETYRFNAQVEQYRQEVLSFQGQIDQVREDMESDYVPFPDSDLYPKYGTTGQVLTTLANGSTMWEDPVVPSDEQAEEVITAWLADHPEATTTVQDGAITFPKLHSSLVNRLQKSSNFMFGTDNTSAYPFSDANNQPANSTYCVLSGVTSTMLQNLPSYGEVSVLTKINFSTDNPHGFFQMFVTPTKMYVRQERATDVYSSWYQVYPAIVPDYSVTYTKLSSSALTRLQKSSNFMFGTDNTSAYPFSDANKQPANSTYCVLSGVTSTMLQNLPSYGETSVLTKINFSSDNGHCFFQMFVTPTKMYVRHESGSSVFTSWYQVYPAVVPNGSVTLPKLNSSLANSLQKSSDFMFGPSNTTDYPFSDANDQPANSTYCVLSGVTAAMFQNLPSYGETSVLTKINFSQYNAHGFFQVFVTPTKVFFREERATDVYSSWYQVYPSDLSNFTNLRTASIFKRVVACGDSYTSGHINGSPTNEDYSWPSYAERITGTEYVNCGSSGATTVSWLTATRGLAKAQTAGRAQAYVIGLMINDVYTEVPLGTQADIGDENPTTYYGALSKIVRELKAISPDAYVFIQTCPRSDSSYNNYNQAVKDVVNAYASTYDTHLLDLREHIGEYQIASITQDYLAAHYTAIGYQQFAEIFVRILSQYIDTHISDFQTVHLIPYD